MKKKNPIPKIINFKRKEKMSYMNLLFIKFLQQMILQANNEGKNSAANTYRKALNSIKKYPLPLRSGLYAKNLMGIGDTVANKLESVFQKYKQNIPKEKTKTKNSPKSKQ